MSTATESIRHLLAAADAAGAADHDDATHDYDAACAALQAAIDAATAAIDIDIDGEGEAPEEIGDMCCGSTEIRLSIGEAELVARGWRLCGYLARGAHADLDGSGLANWGSSQPGGWTCCDGDGQTSGTVRAACDGLQIYMDVGDGGESSARLDIGALLGLDDAESARLVDHCDDALAALVDRIDAAIDGLDLSIPEPTADDAWDELGDDAEVVPGVRVGSPWQAGVVVVVEDDDGDRTVYLAGESWESATRDAAERAVQARIDALAG
jgi:hypothetical protein